MSPIIWSQRVTHQSESDIRDLVSHVKSFLPLVNAASAAAATRRAGPVLAPLRAAGPAAAHNKGPMTEEETPQATGPRAV